MTTKTYEALNPEQLARLFEMRADIAKRFADTDNVSKMRIAWKTEESTWREAAYIVRNTEFVGWNDSMFKVTSETEGSKS